MMRLVLSGGTVHLGRVLGLGDVHCLLESAALRVDHILEVLGVGLPLHLPFFRRVVGDVAVVDSLGLSSLRYGHRPAHQLRR